ncbi:MAG: helix-turn-helix domain-containing protein [Bacteroidales bacterium]|nr:MAG: helix-turn-helix domain-containing protein [Bacteroidales bacterium]
MKLYIKNMVCGRCITNVKAELDKMGIEYSLVELGEVTIMKKLSSIQHKQLFNALKKKGFELIDALKNDIIERLKVAIAHLESNSDENLKTSYSDYISLSVNDNFIYLNTLLADIKGTTIEKFIIKHKIEMVKGLLLNKSLKLDAIALKMRYSNVNKLSVQFKSITGLTPSHFRMLQQMENKNFKSN